MNKDNNQNPNEPFHTKDELEQIGGVVGGPEEVEPDILTAIEDKIDVPESINIGEDKSEYDIDDLAKKEPRIQDSEDDDDISFNV